MPFATNSFKITASFPIVLAILFASGCGQTQAKKDRGFFTSGSREADQRAEQRMAKEQQLQGKSSSAAQNQTPAEAAKKKTLYERLGGEQGISAIVDDFITRALADPRVNWNRSGIKQGGFSFHRNRSVTWNASDENVKMLKQHMAQFFALATGGPVEYQGKEMRQSHASMHITNAEFDAAVGDLKAALDKLTIANPEQKELLAIVESTRPQIVEER